MNGSLIGIVRNDNDDTDLAYNLIRATNWKQNTTYLYDPMHPYDNDSGKEVACYGMLCSLCIVDDYDVMCF